MFLKLIRRIRRRPHDGNRNSGKTAIASNRKAFSGIVAHGHSRHRLESGKGVAVLEQRDYTARRFLRLKSEFCCTNLSVRTLTIAPIRADGAWHSLQQNILAVIDD